jgi:hypothetical protein
VVEASCLPPELIAPVAVGVAPALQWSTVTRIGVGLRTLAEVAWEPSCSQVSWACRIGGIFSTVGQWVLMMVLRWSSLATWGASSAPVLWNLVMTTALA